MNQRGINFVRLRGRIDLFFETLTLIRAVVTDPDRESFGHRIVGIDAPIDLVAAIVGDVGVLNPAIFAYVAKDVGGRGRYEEHAREQRYKTCNNTHPGRLLTKPNCLTT